jgi:GntR family transcriptional regulator
MTTVDEQFCDLLRHLRRQRRWSLRRLAEHVNYSHTYVWEIETGRKHPTVEMAGALDRALDAGGQLAELVNNHPARLLAPESTSGPLDALRRRLEATARDASTYPDSPTAGQWAQLATWLYDLFVRHRPPLVRLGAQRYSPRLRQRIGASPFRIEASRQGRVPHTECRAVAHGPAPADIAGRLHIATGTPVVQRVNWYYADGEPVQTGTTYVPASIAGTSPIATGDALPPGGLYACLEALGHPVAGIRDEVNARLPTPDEAAALGVPPGVPVLEILHTSHDDRQAFEVTRFVMRSDRIAIDYEMPVTE